MFRYVSGACVGSSIMQHACYVGHGLKSVNQNSPPGRYDMSSLTAFKGVSRGLHGGLQ